MTAYPRQVLSSVNQKWQTRDEYFIPWYDRFGFTIDVCASHGDQKLSRYFSPEDDGLAQDWSGEVFWCNPEYGRYQVDWVKYGFAQKADGVFLIPSRTDTRLFHDVIMQGVKEGYCDVEFIKGRLTFGSDAYWEWLWSKETIDGKPNALYGKHGRKNAAPFPSMLVKCGTCKSL